MQKIGTKNILKDLDDYKLANKFYKNGLFSIADKKTLYNEVHL
jgi:hypothetical protein